MQGTQVIQVTLTSITGARDVTPVGEKEKENCQQIFFSHVRKYNIWNKKTQKKKKKHIKNQFDSVCSKFTRSSLN